MCIVGAGFTGLWTAYYLKQADPSLRVVVLEAAFAGFGASGRNGGWLTSALPGSRERYARGPGGRAAVLDLQRQLQQTVDEVARVCAAEGIDADLVKGGELSVATTPAQQERLRAELAADRGWGLGEEDVRYLGPAELADRVRITGGLGALYSPHCARIQPAKLVSGLADGGGARRRRDLRGDPGDPDRAAAHRAGRRAFRTRPARARYSATSQRRLCCAPRRASPPGCPASAGRCCR